MDGRDLEATAQQGGHDGGHFLIEQDEIAHDHRMVPYLPERGVGAERETRLDGNALHRHREVGPWHADAINIAGHQLPRFPQRLLNGLPVRIRCSEKDWRRQNRRARKEHGHAHPRGAWPVDHGVPQSSFSDTVFHSAPFISSTSATGWPSFRAGMTFTARYPLFSFTASVAAASRDRLA